MHSTIRTGWARGAGRAGLGLMAALLFAGCESTTDVTPEDTAVVTSVPTMAAMRATVDMTDDQASQLSPALDRWREAEGSDDAIGTESPALEFLAEAVRVLGRERAGELIGAVVDLQSRAGFGRPRGPGRGHGPGGGILGDLDLSDEQQVALRAARMELHETIRALHEQLADGTITEEEFEAAVAAARDAFDAALQDILSPEQYEQLQQAREDRLVEKLQRQIDGLEERTDRRVEHLTEILDLTDEQAEAIRAILLGTGPELEAILAGLQDGSLSIDDARTALKDLREQTRAAVLEVLTDEQVELYEELDKIRHRGHGGRGHRGGRGR